MNNEKKLQAKAAYATSSLSSVQIADTLDIDHDTLVNWILTEGWEHPGAVIPQPAELIENCHKIYAQYAKQIMTGRDPNKPLTQEEIDVFYSLASTIDMLKGAPVLGESIEQMNDFMTYLAEKDPQMAEQARPHAEEVIAQRIAFYRGQNVLSDYFRPSDDSPAGK